VEKTGAVILAAGGSSRLGQPKQFLLHGGQTLLARTVNAAAGCAPVVVVAGRNAQQVEEELQNRQVWVVHHEEWERGIGTSIRVGVARALEIAPDLDSLIVLVCDQPHVTSTLVTSLREMREQERKPIVTCVYAGSVGVPALFARSLFPELQSLGDTDGAKGIILRSAADVSQVAFPEGAIDIDTPADSLRYLDGTGRAIQA